MSNAISTTTLTSLNVDIVRDPDLRSLTAQISALQDAGALAINETVTKITDIRRAQAPIMVKIANRELYKKDGYKNIAEYGEAIGLGRSTTYQLLRAGEVYNDPKAPAQLKALPPSMIDTLAGAIGRDKKAVYKDAEQGAFDGKTQAELREYAKRPKPGNNASVTNTRMFSPAGYTPADGSEVPVATEETLLERWAGEFDEVAKLFTPKGKPTRYLLVKYGEREFTYELQLVTLIPKRAPTMEDKARAERRAKLIKGLRAGGETDDSINETLVGLGFTPIAKDE